MGLRGALRRSGISVVPGGVEIDGILTAGNVIAGQGKTIYMNPAESAGMTGRTPGTACSTIHEAYAKLTADQNDTLVYLAGATSATITDTLEWAKNYTHFVGYAAPLQNQSRARLFASETAAGYNAFKVSARGCHFSNLRFYQGVDEATAFCVEITGPYNRWDYVTFQGMNYASTAGEATNYSLKLEDCSLNEFYNCTMGGTSTKRTADNSIVLFDGICSQLKFVDCDFLSYAEVNTYCIMKVADGDAIRDFVRFDGCYFYNRWAGKADELLEVWECPVCNHAAIQLKDCSFSCVIEWNAAARACIKVIGATGLAGSTGVGSSGDGISPT